MLSKSKLHYACGFLKRRLAAQKRWHQFSQEFERFKKASNASSPRFLLRWEDRHPCLEDKTSFTGFDRHYIYHVSWAARVLARTKPEYHVDISSSLYFCGIVSAFIPVKFYDFRPADLRLDGLASEAADLTRLPFNDQSVTSLSCMHVVEHVGLGRYGDPLQPDGDLKAIEELKRVVAYGGQILFVVPIGKPRICFNAHRIYGYEQVIEHFTGFKLREFALISESALHGGLLIGASASDVSAEDYGCGCFWFQKDS